MGRPSLKPREWGLGPAQPQALWDFGQARGCHSEDLRGPL